MRKGIHTPARNLLMKSAVEGLTQAEAASLARHLGDCVECAEDARRLDEAVAALRTSAVSVDPALVERARRNLRLRAVDARRGKSSSRLLWAACTATWIWIICSAPFVWQAFAWAGRQIGSAPWVWAMGFGLWYLLPALVVGAALVAAGASDTIPENGYVGI